MIILNIAASPVLRGLPSPRKSTAGEVELLMSRAKATSACEFIMGSTINKISTVGCGFRSMLGA